MRVTSKFPGYSRRESFPWPKRGDILHDLHNFFIGGNVLAGNLPSCVFSVGSSSREGTGKRFPQIRL